MDPPVADGKVMRRETGREFPPSVTGCHSDHLRLESICQAAACLSSRQNNIFVIKNANNSLQDVERLTGWRLAAQQLAVLMWRSWLTRKRSWGTTLVEIASPCIVM